MSTKRQLLITIDAGQITCADCDWHQWGDDEDGDCRLFERLLVDGCVRDPLCIEAEQKAHTHNVVKDKPQVAANSI